MYGRGANILVLSSLLLLLVHLLFQVQLSDPEEHYDIFYVGHAALSPSRQSGVTLLTVQFVHTRCSSMFKSAPASVHESLDFICKATNATMRSKP